MLTDIEKQGNKSNGLPTNKGEVRGQIWKKRKRKTELQGAEAAEMKVVDQSNLYMFQH